MSIKSAISTIKNQAVTAQIVKDYGHRIEDGVMTVSKDEYTDIILRTVPKLTWKTYRLSRELKNLIPSQGLIITMDIQKAGK